MGMQTMTITLMTMMKMMMMDKKRRMMMMRRLKRMESLMMLFMMRGYLLENLGCNRSLLLMKGMLWNRIR